MAAAAAILPFLAKAGAAAATAVGGKAALAATAISAGSSLYGGIRAAQAAEFNRARALEEAAARRAEAAREADQAREQAERVFAQAEVAAGASGATLAGSAADVLGDLAGQDVYRRKSILYRGAAESRNLVAEAEAQRQEGRTALVGSVLDAGGTVLGGLARGRSRKPAPALRTTTPTGVVGPR